VASGCSPDEQSRDFAHWLLLQRPCIGGD